MVSSVAKTLGISVALVASADMGLAQEAGQLPAVSGPNGNLSVGGFSLDGTDDGSGRFEVRGSYTFPLTYETGFQIDGNIASVEDGDATWVSVGGHYFWRDPSAYLFGAYGEFNSYDSVNYGVAAAEAEAYFGQFSLTTATGLEFGDVATSFFTDTYANYYLTDDFMLSAGYRHDSAGSYAQGRLEYQVMPDYSGMSLFADSKWNEDGFDSIFAGVKFYFGNTKSLKRRHREDDPTSHANPSSGAKESNKVTPVVAAPVAIEVEAE